MRNEFHGPLKRWRKQDWFHWDSAKKSLEYCGEKIIYHSEEEANTQRLRQEAKAGHSLFIYECPHGPHFHLTKQGAY